MKIKLFEKKKNFKKKEFSLNSDLYWKLIVLCAFVLIISSFYFSYRLFTRINLEPPLPENNIEGKVPMVKEDMLKKALDYFSEREKKSSEIMSSPASVVDPSL